MDERASERGVSGRKRANERVVERNHKEDGAQTNNPLVLLACVVLRPVVRVESSGFPPSPPLSARIHRLRITSPARKRSRSVRGGRMSPEKEVMSFLNALEVLLGRGDIISFAVAHSIHWLGLRRVLPASEQASG